MAELTLAVVIFALGVIAGLRAERGNVSQEKA